MALSLALSPPPGFRGTYRDDPAARGVYAEAAGIQQIWPMAVAVPADADDVAPLVRWARAQNISLVARGSGTSMAGGAVGAGVIVDLSRLRQIDGVDTARRRVWVGPGAVRADVDAAARVCGLHFPVDPSSGEYCTVGGMVSTNAAGAHTLRYGSVRPWVTALDCVFADGTRATIRRGEAPPRQVPALQRLDATAAPAIRAASVASLCHAGVRKDSSGYALAQYAAYGDPTDLLVGSEGTLALFVGVELALVPIPGATASVLAAFSSLDAAMRGAAAARDATASACELLDRTFLDLVRGVAGAAGAADAAAPIPASTDAVLLIEVEGDTTVAVRTAASALERALRTAGATHLVLALDAAAEHALWALRHAASPVLARLDPALKSMQFIEDGAVPPAVLADYVRGVRAALERHRVRGAIFGHAGDAHIHVNPLIDVRHPGWRDQVAGLLADVTALTARLHGTLTGEHGDGRLRTPLLSAMWSGAQAPALALFAAVKSAFDPDCLLNPGVKVPTLGQHALGPIKYDPALPALPPAARRALDHVSEHRAYALSRLDLLDSSG